MAQSTFTIVTRINPNDLDALDRLLSGIGHDVEKNQYLRFAEIAALHMAGIVIAAQDPRFPPILIFESNFDGTADEYLHALIDHGRAGIDAIYSKCEGYPSENARTNASVMAHLREHSLPAAAFFVGLPGQTVASIRNAIAVREEINRFLDAEVDKNSIQGLSAFEIRDRIVAHLEHDSPVKPEIPQATFSSYRRVAQRNTIIACLVGLIVGVILSPLLIAWILAVRYLEVREQKMAPQPDPPVDERTYAMEDLFTQNHLATIGVVKDNPVRRFTIRTAVAAVGIMFQRLLLRGGFGGVFTLHFAHVVWLDEGRRILLLTGYDGSALEYLGNFTDSAGFYLNGAYGNVNNYPACRWLIGRGAASANGFANWGRQHMQYTPVFYSAYPQETVLNLMNDLDIRDHLAAARSEREVERLLKLL
ncbi:MAG: hypothetical protein WBY93_19040 [Candidatus Binatus sp.]